MPRSVNGEFQSVGKLGAAVLGNHASKEVRAGVARLIRPPSPCVNPPLHHGADPYGMAARRAQYKVLLYQANKQPVAQAAVHGAFSFIVQDNCYASFYDDQAQNWSVRFDAPAQAEAFATQVGLLTRYAAYLT